MNQPTGLLKVTRGSGCDFLSPEYTFDISMILSPNVVNLFSLVANAHARSMSLSSTMYVAALPL